MALEVARALIKKHPVLVFSWTVCPYCAKAKKFLNLAGAQFHAEELNQRSDGDDIKNALHKSITGCETVPQVFIHGKFIGGGNDTESKYNSGELAKLLQEGSKTAAL